MNFFFIKTVYQIEDIKMLSKTLYRDWWRMLEFISGSPARTAPQEAVLIR